MRADHDHPTGTDAGARPGAVTRRRFLGYGATGLGVGAALGISGGLPASLARRMVTPASAAPARSLAYGPTAGSLSGHPLPGWWSDAKFGVFIHWGAYAVPAYSPKNWIAEGSGWYWAFQQVAGTPHYFHHRQTYGTKVVYDDFLPQFRAEQYDPESWIDLIERAGARYFVLTTKHHDGFCLFPSQQTNRNAAAIGPGRDLVAPLVAAGRNRNLKVGLYYSVPEWYNPAPATDLTVAKVRNVLGELHGDVTSAVANEVMNALGIVGFNESTPKNAYTAATVPYRGYKPVKSYGAFERAQLRELVDWYHPDEIWADIGGPESYFRGNEVIADFYNQALTHNPDGVVVNDRFGDSTTHRDYAVYENGGSYSLGSYTGAPMETVRTMGQSWGYNRYETDYGTVAGFIGELVTAVANNSNYVLNIGPRSDGTIVQPMIDRLVGIGDWLAINGEAIYGSRPWTTAVVDDVRFTRRGDVVYLISIGWPGKALKVKAPVHTTSTSTITLLGSNGAPLAYTNTGGVLTITTPAGGVASAATTSQHAFVFRVSP